jgi:uncharacterized protein YaiI (UPF0178 family)
MCLGRPGARSRRKTIGMAVAMRDLKQHLRETGESKGYNASFAPQDRSRFLGELDRILRRAQQNRDRSSAIMHTVKSAIISES